MIDEDYKHSVWPEIMKGYNAWNLYVSSVLWQIKNLDRRSNSAKMIKEKY